MSTKDNDIDSLQDIIPGLSDGEFEKFRLYFEILTQFNSRMNLVSQATIHQAGRRHFADSYIGIKLIDSEIPSGEIVYDFGSGNGFPGIIFAAMRPDLKLILVERDRRKCEFLKHVVHSLELSNTEVHTGNARDLKNEIARFGVSRAMSPLPKMLLETRDIFAEGGHLYLFKGEYWSGEYSAMPAQLFDYWEVVPKANYEVPDEGIVKVILDCVRISN